MNKEDGMHWHVHYLDKRKAGATIRNDPSSISINSACPSALLCYVQMMTAKIPVNTVLSDSHDENSSRNF